MVTTKSPVILVRTESRQEGVSASLRALNVNPAKGKHVLIKPNFNTADPTPGSTHNDTLGALAKELWAMGAKSISLGERSWPRTKKVMELKGVLPVLQKLDVRVIDFDDLKEEDWVEFKPKSSHWGKRLPRCATYSGGRMLGFHRLSENTSIRRSLYLILKTSCRRCSYGASRLFLYA